MTPRSEVYAAIDSERDYQDKLWPADTGEGCPNPLTIGEQILLLKVYVDKAAVCFSQESKPEIEALNNIRKIAGIAVNCMEQHGAPRREHSL